MNPHPSMESTYFKVNTKTIITSLKALDEGFSSKNYVRKFLRALHPKWRAKVTVIEELKDLSSLALDELIGNLKVHEVIMEKDSKFTKEKRKGSKEKKSFRQMDDKKSKSDMKSFRCGDPNHLISEFPKPPRNKEQKAFVMGSWSDSENEAEEKINDETCLMAQSSNEVTLYYSYFSDNVSSLDDDSMQAEYNNLCEISLKIINKNKILKTKKELLEKEILELNEKIKKLERNKEVDIECNGSTVKADGSTVPGTVNPSTSQNVAENVLNPRTSSRSDFVIVRKKLIHKSIENSERPPLK
ncbi:hypothetical protein Tco_0669961 [Tanacetum coccineum]